MSNVNPDHYKVGGRERQGDNILQERHRQKHAQSLARQRFEPRFSTPPQPVMAAAPSEDASPEPATTKLPAAKQKRTTGSGSTRKTTKRTPTKAAAPQKAKAAVKASSGKTSSRKTSSGKAKAAKRPAGKAKSTAKTPARKSAAKRTTPLSSRRTAGGGQASGKRGKRSTAQKRASSRNDFDSMPATRPVAGAFGRRSSKKGGKKR